MKSLYDCSICKDTSWIIGLNGVAKRCACFEQDIVRDSWKNAGFKIEDINKTFKTFQPWNKTTENLKTVATNYCLRFNTIKNDRENSILLCGNPGAGKTHLLMALANNFMKKQIQVVYMPYRDVLTDLKQNFLDNAYYKKILNKYQSAEILFIDDLFKGKISDTDINIMFEIINHRYINSRPMMISSEFKVEEILNIDEAIGSRIYETCKKFVFEVIGKENNFRLK